MRCLPYATNVAVCYYRSTKGHKGVLQNDTVKWLRRFKLPRGQLRFLAIRRTRGQSEPERAALARSRLDLQRAAERAGQAVRDREPQSSALAWIGFELDELFEN